MLIISVYAKLHLQRKRRAATPASSFKAGGAGGGGGAGGAGGAAAGAGGGAAGGAGAAAAVEEVSLEVGELRPDKVLLEVQAGLGKVEWNEVEEGADGKMHIVRKGDTSKEDKEALQNAHGHVFMLEFNRAPSSQRPMLLAKQLVELQAKTAATLGHLDAKMEKVTAALSSLAAGLASGSPAAGRARRRGPPPRRSCRRRVASASRASGTRRRASSTREELRNASVGKGATRGVAREACTQGAPAVGVATPPRPASMAPICTKAHHDHTPCRACVR